MGNHTDAPFLSFSGIVKRIQEKVIARRRRNRLTLLEGIVRGGGFRRDDIVATLKVEDMVPAEPFPKTVREKDVVLVMGGRTSVALRMDGADREGKARISALEDGKGTLEHRLGKGESAVVWQGNVGEMLIPNAVTLTMTRLPTEDGRVRLEFSVAYKSGLAEF